MTYDEWFAKTYLLWILLWILASPIADYLHRKFGWKKEDAFTYAFTAGQVIYAGLGFDYTII